MEGLTDLLESIVKNGSSKSLNSFMNSCSELKIFQRKTDSDIVPIINSLLNENNTRKEGVIILQVYISQCKKTTISENLISWCQQNLKGMQNGFLLSYDLLGLLLKLSTEFPDIRKQCPQNIVPKVMDLLCDKLKDNSQSLIPILKCLETCLSTYGKSCGNYRDGLESTLLTLLERETAVIHYVSRCLLQLLQTGPPGIDNCNYKVAWKSQQLLVIKTMYSLLDRLFSDITEIKGSFEKPNIEKKKLQIPVVKEKSPVIKIQRLSLQFCNLSYVLESLLLNSFVAAKTIVPENFFSVLWRTLSVTCITLAANVSTERYALISVVPDLHISSLRVLNALILSCRTNLLPYASLISKMLVQILKWTDTKHYGYGQGKPYSALREACYKCLSSWITVAGCGSLLEHHIDIIIGAIISDINYEKPAISLNVEVKVAKRSKKKKASAAAAVAKEDRLENPIDLKANQALCEAALRFIPLFVESLSPLIPPSHHKTLQEVVVKVLLELEKTVLSDGGVAVPYSEPAARRGLYRSLLVLCVAPHPGFPPPLNYAKQIFTYGTTDSSPIVREVCSVGLTIIGHLMRPSYPSFDLPVCTSEQLVPINPVEVRLKGVSVVVEKSELPKAQSSSDLQDSTDTDVVTIHEEADVEEIVQEEEADIEEIVQEEEASRRNEKESSEVMIIIENDPLRIENGATDNDVILDKEIIHITNIDDEDNVLFENNRTDENNHCSNDTIDLADSSSNDSVVLLEDKPQSEREASKRKLVTTETVPSKKHLSIPSESTNVIIDDDEEEDMMNSFVDSVPEG